MDFFVIITRTEPENNWRFFSLNKIDVAYY